jgi:hypothetical protein
MQLRRDPDFAITSLNWDTFAGWEWHPDRRAGYLNDADWDRDWVLAASSDNDNEEEDEGDEQEEDYHDHNGQGCVGVQAQQPPRVSGVVSGQIYNGKVVRDDTDDMINHVVYHYFQAAGGETYVMPPELTEEEQLAVAALISQEEGRRAFPGFEDALALSVAPPPPPGPPPLQAPRTPPARSRRNARMEP